MRAFALAGQRYREQDSTEPRLCLTRDWLRFYDAEGRWIPRPAERERQRAEDARACAEQERARAEQALAEAERLRALVRLLGGDPDT